MTGEAVLSVRGLGATAGGTVILSGVSFDVAAGEVVALVGPSGAGKSTVAAAVAGVARPRLAITGEIATGGRVGYLPQDAASTLNPARRVGTALRELIRLHHPAPHADHLARILYTAALDLPDRALRRYPFEFSGGQRARLALAQVLATEPAAIVLDEPTVGLDPITRAALASQLDALRRSGVAVLVVTHDPYLAERISDRTLHLHAGRLHEPPASAPPAPIPSPPPRVASHRAVELRGVSVSHRHVPVLHDVDLHAEDGETLGIVGVSGAGKTTIARCIAGLRTPERGSVLIDGRPFPPLRGRSRTQLAHVQYLWQESSPSFDARRTMLDQVAATAVRLRERPPAAAREEALDLLAELGLAAEQARRPPTELSGGQLQRAALARALLARPRVLICDEVTTGLDRPLAEQILDHIQDYQRRTGATVLSISHDIPGQLARADRVAVIHAGRVVAVGRPGELVGDAEPGVLRDLLAAGESGAV